MTKHLVAYVNSTGVTCRCGVFVAPSKGWHRFDESVVYWRQDATCAACLDPATPWPKEVRK